MFSDIYAPNTHVPGTSRRRADVVRRQLTAEYEVYRNALKAMVRDDSIFAPLKFIISLKLHSLPRNTCPNRIVTRCIINRRSRGVLSHFRVNRVELKLRLMRGQVSGMSRAAWHSYGRQIHESWKIRAN